ncbi:hypothetical protein JR316_0012405 [Psilocybe cubensis]|uniref:Uncharacterized protein n=2 Tax=Psilocybe cubensis TaxID=181762 RepID=A0ACB8GJQ1_PSICU|nr:hypothetical protein JR316_0012405 [Psilocybe cubensis]KAH9475294.1 hypothetical protein JR316_0012405 [Psilocybe cubensis]
MINDYFYAGYPEVDNLVQEMLATNPEERPTADKAMERLNNFLLLWVPRDPEGLQVLQFS